MNDQPVEFKLDTLTQSTRFVFGIAPRTATRVGLGAALAIEDSATDPTGKLLGAKVHKGATVLASGLGSITAKVRDRARAQAALVANDDSLASLPAIEKTHGFVSQAVSEVRGAWANAGYVTMPFDGQGAAVADVPASSSEGADLASATDVSEAPMVP